MSELKGSKTEQNLITALLVNLRRIPNINTMLHRPKRTVMCRFPGFLRKLPPMKRSMPKSGLSCCMTTLCPKPSKPEGRRRGRKF